MVPKPNQLFAALRQDRDGGRGSGTLPAELRQTESVKAEST